MKFLIDMNLSPDWISVIEKKGFHAIHWSKIGKADAPDKEIFEYASENNFVIFTHDLDFGDILAASGAKSPSVIQIRMQNTSPQTLKNLFFKAIKQFRQYLKDGALITIDPDKLRARILPVNDIME